MRAVSFANRPLWVAAGAAGAGFLLFLGTGALAVLPWRFAAVGLIACVMVLGIIGSALWQNESLLRARARDERDRMHRVEAARTQRLNAARQEHTIALRDWEERRRAYEQQREWYPVTLPPGADRVDIVGGTLAGWTAAVTMMGAARLAVGSQLTVIDLSEGAVAQDLVRLAGSRGDDPLVWVLPSDLARLDLTGRLDAEAMADVLSLVVGASEERSTTRDLSFDNAILERVISVFGGTATIAQITAALRALAQVGDPRDDLDRGLITDAQLDRVTRLFGRGATDQVVIERAWALEAQLRKLENLGTEPVRLPPSRLHVVSMDRRAGVLTNRILGTYVATSLTHALRESPAGRRWDHTLFLCGAETLRGDVLDRLIHACEATGTGLVLMYRSMPPHVRSRLGRAHAAVGFMRLGNAKDARFAAEHIGTEQRLQVAQITDTVGDVISHHKDDPYASTVAYARIRGDAPLTDPVWSPLPEPEHDPKVLAEGISASTGWGQSVTRLGEPQRFRELLVEPHELQQLPPTAMVLTHAIGNRRQVMLVDVNPGIITLPTTHALEYDDDLREQAVSGEGGGTAPPEAGTPAVGDMGKGGDAGEAREIGDAGETGNAGEAAEAGDADEVGRPAEVREVSGGAMAALPGRAAQGTPKRARARHAATRGMVRRYRRSVTPRSTNATPPPSLGPPSERLDFRRGKP